MRDDDRWADWLLLHRHGDDDARRADVLGSVGAIAERVLRRAAPGAGEVLGDLGCGDGELGLRALARDPSLRLLFVDGSARLLAAARSHAEARGDAERCAFVRTDLATLDGVADGALDVAVARAAFAHVPDKAAAFRALARVLRPGGRFAIGEPIFQDAALRQIAFRRSLDAAGDLVGDLALLHRWRATALPDTIEAMRATATTAFAERDLLGWARAAGFVDLHVRLHVDDVPVAPVRWEALLASALLPGAPTLAEALERHFTPAERERFERRFRPLFESGGFGAEQVTTAYVWGRTPGDARA